MLLKRTVASSKDANRIRGVNLYIFSVIKNLFKPSNIGTIIFFLLNAYVVIGLVSYADPDLIWVMAILYLISVIFALSPVGEWILGIMSGARRMTRSDMRARMLPLITRVHNKALAKTPKMTRIINLKVMYDPNPNAFALGRHTICVTEGLFELPDDMIEGILAHEMGHLACHHTDIQLLIGGGNFIITFALLIAKLIGSIMMFFGTLFSFSRNDTTHGCGCAFSIVGMICSLLVWLWTKFCMLFLMWSSRANEFVADKYAMEIGYGYELASALDYLGAGAPQNSFMRALYATHPETNDRIGKLQELGVPYTRF